MQHNPWCLRAPSHPLFSLKQHGPYKLTYLDEKYKDEQITQRPWRQHGQPQMETNIQDLGLAFMDQCLLINPYLGINGSKFRYFKKALLQVIFWVHNLSTSH